jgi:hypothetical protein
MAEPVSGREMAFVWATLVLVSASIWLLPVLLR